LSGISGIGVVLLDSGIKFVIKGINEVVNEVFDVGDKVVVDSLGGGDFNEHGGDGEDVVSGGDLAKGFVDVGEMLGDFLVTEFKKGSVKILVVDFLEESQSILSSINSTLVSR